MRTRRNILIVAAIAVAAAVAIAAFAAYSLQRSTAVAHRLAIAHAVTEKFYTSLIEEYFSTYEPRTIVCVNKPYNRACLNIVVAENLDADARTTLYADNLSAIGTNLIVADKKVLDLLLLASSYAFKAQMAKFIFPGLGLGPFAADVLWGQRYTAIKRDLDNKSGGQAASHEIGRVKAGISGSEETMARASDEIKRVYGGDPGNFIKQLTSLNFGFLLQHEIGHLKMSLLRRWALRAKALATLDFASVGRAEEDEVDRLARDRTEQLMSAARKLSPVMDGTDIERSILYANFLFFWTDGLFSFFEGRNGQYAEDFLFEINFRECSLDNSLYATIPDEVLAMLPSVTNARLRPLPVLTRKEFSELGRHLRSSKVHSHSAIRAAYLLYLIIDNLEKKYPGFDRAQIGVVPAAVISAIDGREERDAHFRASLPATKIKKTQLTTIEQRERGHLCIFDDCEVVQNRLTRVEVLAEDDVIHEIVLRTAWPAAKTDILWQRVMDLAAEDVGVQRSKIEVQIDELIQQCPGSYRIVEQSSVGDFIYIGRAATKGFITVRVLAAE